MKNLHINIFLLIAMFYNTSVTAQTEPMYSQYMYNMLAVNPAYAGNREATSLNFFQRRQWLGLKGAPQTTSVCLDGSAYNSKMGWGFQLYDDRLGVEKADGLNYMIANRVRVSDIGILSGGLSVGLMNYRIDLLNIANINDPTDPAYYSNLNKWLPNIGWGLYYNTDHFYVGVSVPNILRSRLSSIETIKSGLQKVNDKHLFITTGVVIELNEDVKIKPSTMIKLVSGAPLQADFNTNIWLKEVLGLGVSYRTGDAIVAMGEFQINENLRFGYAYDMTMSPLKYYNNGSHEIMLRYEFGNFKTKIKSTRFF